MPAPTGKWLAIVGIGEDGIAGLGADARAAIAGAAHVFGGRRHLKLADSLIAGVRHPWPQPFDAAMADVVALRGERVCVLASGDPFLHGVGATLARVVDAAEIETWPAPSAFSLAAARLGWPLQQVDCVSLHAGRVETLWRYLQPGARIVALTTGADSPAAIATFLTERGFGRSGLIVLEAIGGAGERATRMTAGTFAMTSVDPLNVVAIDVAADGPATRIAAHAPGMPDDWFEHDGQLTKREIRAATLSALAPRRGELLWDIGAGSGSISIEWLLAHPSMRAIAIESDPARAARIRRNADAFGVPALEIVEGHAPGALGGLAAPDAIFIGGGGGDPDLAAAAMAALGAGGRLVVNAVTLETETALAALHRDHGGALVRIAVSRAEPVGTMTGWRPAMPVTQWSWRKPGGDR